MKRLVIVSCVLCCTLALFAQAVQPSLMIFPDQAWCQRNGFLKTITRTDGKEVYLPDYQKALIFNQDLGPAINAVGTLLGDRGFAPKKLDEALSALDTETALENASDMDIATSDYDRIIEAAGPDIAIRMNYYTEEQGPRVTLFYELNAYDAYTSKPIAGTGLISYGPVMKMPLQNLIQTALLGSIDAFTARLTEHFLDMKENGREVSVKFKVIADWEDGMYTEINGLELMEIIEEWMYDNCVAGRNHQKAATDNLIDYDSARIPLYDDEGRPVNARQWLNKFRKELRAIDVKSKIQTRGLGQAILIIGE